MHRLFSIEYEKHMCKNLGLVGKVWANMENVFCLMQSWVITQLEFYRRVKFKHFCRNSSFEEVSADEISSDDELTT